MPWLCGSPSCAGPQGHWGRWLSQIGSLWIHAGGLGVASPLSLIPKLLVPQILLKEYSFDSRHKPAFTEEDVLNIFPVVKHVNPKASDAFHFFQSGQAKVQQGAWPGMPGEVGASLSLL